MIEAELHDGTVLEFPDGTDPSVVQRVVKQHLGVSEPQTGYDRAAAHAKEILALDQKTRLTPGMDRSYDQGLFQGFSDEMAGGADALAVGAGNLVRKAQGKPIPYTMGEAYRAGRDVERGALAGYSQAHPMASALADVTGSSLPFFFLPGSGGSGLGAIGKGAVQGAGAGALSGALQGAGKSDNRLVGGLEGAAGGALAGGGIGGLAPVAGSVLGALGGAVVKGGKSVLSEAGALGSDIGAVTSEHTKAALGRVMQLLKSKGMDINDLASASSKPITTAEVLGRPGVTMAGSVARRAGATGDAAEAQIGERAMNTGNRILEDYASATGVHPSAAQGDIDGLVKAGREKAGPLFGQAFAGTPGPLIDNDLKALAQRPVVKNAISDVANDMLNAGKDPTAAGLVKRVEQVPGGGTRDVWDQVSAPTAETWDAVRQAIGRQVERDPFTKKPIPNSQSRGNGSVSVASRDLTTALKDKIPGLDNALSHSADYLQAGQAFSDGQKMILNSQVTADQFAKRMADMTPAEQEAFSGGAGNALYNGVQKGTLRPRLLSAPVVQSKLSQIMGDKAPDFLDKLSTEAQMARTGAKIAPGGGSDTFALLNAADETDKGIDYASLAKSALSAKANPLGFVADLAAKGVTQADTLGTTVGFRNELGRLLLQHPSDTLNELRAFTPDPPTAAEKLLSGLTSAPASALSGYATPRPTGISIQVEGQPGTYTQYDNGQGALQ